MLKFLLVAALVVVSAKALNKETEEAIDAKMMPYVKECAKEYSIKESALTEENLQSLPPCFFSCVFQKIGMMDADGKFDAKQALEELKPFLTDEADLKSASEVAESCTSVNSEDVTNEKPTCERAKMLDNCLEKNKDKFWAP